MESKSYSIVFVSSHLGHVRGGAEINDLKLGRELTELGHDVQYITQQDPNRNPRELDVDCRIIDMPYLYGRSYDLFEPAGKILRHLNEEWFRWKINRTAPPELSEANFVLTTGRPLLVKLKSIADTPVFHAVRGTVNPLYHRYLTQADGLIFWGGCESEYSDKRILSQPRLTIDPAVNGSMFHPRDVETEVSDKWRNDEDLLAVFVGRLEPVKRVDALIDAVSDADNDIRLLVVGNGSREATLQEHAERVAPNSVSFLGYCEQETVAQLLNVADAFALASEHENHPIALKEALACGTYCIAPDVGRVESMVSSAAGTVVPDNDVKTLSAALDDAASEGVTAKDRFERARSQNAWRDNAEAVIEFYERTLRGNTGEQLA